jgi:hypothetical protein
VRRLPGSGGGGTASAVLGAAVSRMAQASCALSIDLPISSTLVVAVCGGTCAVRVCCARLPKGRTWELGDSV